MLLKNDLDREATQKLKNMTTRDLIGGVFDLWCATSEKVQVATPPLNNCASLLRRKTLREDLLAPGDLDADEKDGGKGLSTSARGVRGLVLTQRVPQINVMLEAETAFASLCKNDERTRSGIWLLFNFLSCNTGLDTPSEP